LVEWLARGELESLPPELAAHARLISLLGAEVGVDELVAILRRLDRAGAGAGFPLDAAIGTRRLLAAGVVVEPSPGRVCFRHALFRETIAAATPPGQQASIHEAAFVYYRDAIELASEHRLPRLAYQASLSGHRVEAAAAYLELARQARDRHAYLDSEHMFDRALAHVDETPSAARLEALHGRGRARHRLTQLDGACNDFRLARALAAALGERAREVEALLDEAEVLDWRDEWQRSRERVEEAREALRGVDSALLSARLDLAAGRSLFRFSRRVEARELLERAAAEGEALGDAGYETFAVALVLLGYELAGLGELEGSAAAFERVIPAAEQRGDLWHLAAALNNRYRLWVARNERDRLTEDLGRVAKIGRELGFDRMEWFAHFNLAEALYRLDDLDAALEHAAQAVEVDETSLGDAGRPLGKLLHARILAFKGDRNGARRMFQRIRAHQNTAADDATLVPADQVLLGMVDLLTRSAADEAWAALCDRAREHCAGPELLEVLEARGVAAARAGDSRGAILAFESALQAAGSSAPVTAGRLERAIAAAGGA
jgi:tetratricopeptide (TPR) repeat protein